jgi:hypothetical protein
MKCMDFPLKYVGQTSPIFYTTYTEHIQAIGNNNGNSGYSNHILSAAHTYRNIADTMNIIKTEKNT